MRKFLATLGLGLALSLPSCLGPNVAFEGVRDWNSQVTESKIVNELIFLGLNFIPVYPIAYFADTVVLNSLMWWKISDEPMIEFSAEYTPQGSIGF